MLSSENFDALRTSLLQSLQNCQYENLGRSFDKDAQYAFGANRYGTLTAFNTEFETWLYNADKDRLSEYVKDVYYPIARYGVLFTCLVQDYERRLAGNGRSQLSSESYALVYAYQESIRHEVNRMHRDAAKYAKVDLTGFQELTLDSFTIDGKYIDNPAPAPSTPPLTVEPIDVPEIIHLPVPAPANDETRLTDGKQPGVNAYNIDSPAPATSTPDPAPSTPSTDDESNSNDCKKQHIRQILAPLGGLSPAKQPIMSQADFDRLINYVDHLVLTNSLPNEILPINRTGISNEHIRYTFYRLHKELFGKRKHPEFLSFIHTVFKQFAGTSETTTNSKFATAPKSYHKDFAGYIGELA